MKARILIITMNIIMEEGARKILHDVLKIIKYKAELKPDPTSREIAVQKELLKRELANSRGIVESTQRENFYLFPFLVGKRVDLILEDLDGGKIKLGKISIEDILGVFKQRGILKDFLLKKDGNGAKYELVLGNQFKNTSEELLGNNNQKSTNSGNLTEPYTEVKAGKGFLKFDSNDNVFVGGKDTKKFKFIQCLCSPKFGIHKTVDFVFQSIKTEKDTKSQDLQTYSHLSRETVLWKIKIQIKELQKIKGLQGKINYKFDVAKKIMWLELEG